MGYLIRGAKVVTASDSFEADVRISGETISEIGKGLSPASDEKVIDANGRWLIPGGIDPHVHMELPFMGTISKDDFDSGSQCALAGGTTTLIDFIIPTKGGSYFEAIKKWDEKAKPKARCDFGYHGTILEWNEKTAEEIPKLINEYGITSFKIFLAYLGALYVDDVVAFNILRSVSKAGGLISCHAVNGSVITTLCDDFAKAGKLDPLHHALSQPPEAEGEAVSRMIRFSEIANSPIYIVHTTAIEALHELARGQKRDKAAAVFGETCPQYLFLTQDLYKKPNFEGAKYVLSPPIRPEEHTEAMWRALKDHTIQVVGTDHCSFDFKGQKDMGRDDFRKIPNGFNGIEERVPLLYSYGVAEGRISAERWVAVTSTNVAKVFGLYPKKGAILPGSDADVVLWDPKAAGVISAKTHKSRCDYNVYEGYKISGKASVTFQRGKIVYENGEVIAQPGDGRYLKRAKHNPRCLG